MKKEPQKEVAVGRCADFSLPQIQLSLEDVPSDVLMKGTVVGM